jgi:hypothetical protein
MICIFPDPHPDELLYSVCARYNALMDYPNSATATRDFFGEGGVAAVVGLPNRLDHLVAALPLGHLYSIDELIYRNTHYPFYAPFLPPNRALLVRNAMLESGHNRVAERIGLSADRLKMPTHLQFCPSCIEQDRANFGETYWHRVHQIPGVEVCPHHAVFLEKSNTLWRNSRNPSVAFPAEQSVYDSPVRTLDTSEHIQRIQLNIAQYALWLLEWSGGNIVGQTLRLRYHNLLVRQGLAYYNGQVRTAQLVRKLLDYYSNELLSRLGCEFRNPHSNWLLRLLHIHKAGVTQHPIRHILFLILIGCSPEDVLDSFIEFKPFGDGPWPCLNHASGHYAEPRVFSCRVTDGEKKNKGKPIGTFSCSCGFIYTRTGPDEAKDKCFKWISIHSYGPGWGKLLKLLWEDTSVTLRQVSQELGVNELTVKRRAISLGLTFPRPTPGSMRFNGEILNRYKLKRKSIHEKQNINRETLLSLVNDNPQASRAELQALAPHLLDWLRRWDREWLNTSLPFAKAKQPPLATINWEEQDLLMSVAVETAVSNIYSALDPPQRVSITAIIKTVGRRTWIEKNLDRMPLTSKTLEAHLESFEDYLIRRIAWAAEAFRKGGVIPSRATLSNRVGIKGRQSSQSERVQGALDSALQI